MKNKILIGIILIASITIILVLNKKIITRTEKETEASCFEFDKETGEILGYLEICTKEVVIPEKIEGVEVTKIKSFAFRNKNITKVVLPKGMKEIGSGAFQNNEIKVLKLNEGLTIIKPYAFNENKIEKLEIPTTVNNIGREAFNNNVLRKQDAFIYFRNDDGTENKTMIIGYGGKEKEVIIPEGVESLNIDSLSGNGIEKITFPKTLTRIDARALQNNEIKEIIIPAEIVHLGEEMLLDNPIEKIIIKGKKTLEEFIYVGENWNNGFKKVKFE